MEKSFKGMSIDEYLGRLGSAAPTPGGGAAAALTSAQGAALVMMVANLTIGKPEYAEFEELNKDILSEAEVLLGSLTDGIDNDADAFGKLAAAYAMPRGQNKGSADKDGDTEDPLAKERREAITSASILAAEAPLMVMEDSLAVLRLAATLQGRSNKNLESDIYVAALCLYSGIKSAKINVDENLKVLWKADPYNAHLMDCRATDVLTDATLIITELSHRRNAEQKTEE